LEVFT